jgi:hypothetical protein
MHQYVMIACMAIAFQAPEPQPTPVIPPRPVAVITDSFGNPPPESTPLGEALYFSSAKSTTGKGRPSWTVFPPERSVRSSIHDDGKTLVVSTGVKPTRLLVILSVAKGDEVDTTTINVDIGAVGPVVPDPVIPTPGPKPDVNPALISIGTPPLNGRKEVGLAIQRATGTATSDTKLDSFLVTLGDEMINAVGITTMKEWVPWRDKMLKEIVAKAGPNVKDQLPYWRSVAEQLGK